MPATLHLPTLIFACALGVGFAGVMMVLSQWRARPSAALTLWGSAMILSAAGLMILVDGILPDLPAELLGDTVLVLGAALSWAGARAFNDRRVTPLVLAAGPLVLLAVTAIDGVNRAHLLLTVLFVGAYSLAAAHEIQRGSTERLPSRNIAAALAALHAALQFGRAALMCFAPALLLANHHLLYEIVFLEALLYAIGLSNALLSMLREQAEWRAMLRLRDMAMTDELTGLGNRRRFDQALALTAAHTHSIGLLMVDVDHFKLYNDTYGHLPGDDCLRTIAAAIAQVARREDATAARFGGEEFAILLARAEEADAMRLATRIHEAVAGLAIPHAQSPYGMLTVSIGVAAVATGSLRDVLVKRADWALYVAKAEGRNSSRAASEIRESGVLRQV